MLLFSIIDLLILQFFQLVDLNERNGLKVIEKGGVNTFPFAFSPDKMIGSVFGMLLYTISEKI